METSKVDWVLINKVKFAAYKYIETIVFKFDGVIFGGYVRDEYIREYNKSLFKCDDVKYGECYWDKKISPETYARTIISRDMDCSFNNLILAHNFINKLSERNSDIKNVIIKHGHNYYNETIEIVMKLELDLAILSIPFINEGVNIKIYIDIVVPKVQMMAPFGNIDMLCNGFIKTRDGKMFSRNTGTIIDSLNDYDRHKVIGYILDDLIKFKTRLCFNNASNKINEMALNRILKMQRRKYKWHYINLPFNTEESKGTDECCICQDDIKKGRCSVFVGRSALKTHYSCCMKYLEKQKDDGIESSFKSPCRGDIDFRTCNIDIWIKSIIDNKK